MAFKVLLLAAVAALAAADRAPSYSPPRPTYSPPQPSYGPAEPTAPAQYNFNWAVKDDYSSNDFGQEENRNGYDTQGSYYVLLPDGRLQRVSYTVNGDSGFVAEVSYEGEAQPSYSRPQPTYQQPQPQPTYSRPQPTYQQPQPQPTYG
ncbi:uncharacterized protein LOC127000552 isoform X1 [Eriocheir sinensis]|uniref:uncharacterized protein LOC127000552 isoform X1 n=1 Tax=Eriocheir sinensis TaxID=95602 RepID=UPI0021C6EBEF|nr:uncharacterized protein LOC127000552 isoform X1 [Eriocheir sinensis]